ncbi:MAG TPA: hypothetical protein DDX71_00665 [Ruminococcus sp.]|nr:hypothetical protein [Ruminococcus sp.]
MIQITKPEKGDPFFNNAAGGGISTCITIKNCEPGLNVLPNCVGGAIGAYNKAACGDGPATFKHLSYPPNAENIMARAEQEGLPISQKPAVGALIVWQKGETLSSADGAGHIAFVTSVDADGTIHTAESEYGGRAWVNRAYKPPYVYGSAYKFLGFILQPSKPVPVKVLREGDHGAEVELMQARLHALGYMRRGEVDGDFGKITKGAVLCFQIEHGLEVDGVCGPATQAALAK